MIAPWAEKYLEVPWDGSGTAGSFSGCNCYGLLRLIFREEFGIILPGYEGEAYSRGVDKEALGKKFERGRQQWTEVKVPTVGDVAWLRIAGHPFHVGVMVSPEHFIHIEEGCGPVIESIKSPRWARRVHGFARW